jgi:metal-responsive CopG/Arc/MetJ family transcriptional regulator
MAVNTVNISFQKDLLSQLDQAAKEESRSRSEIIREAARLYLERKNRWKTIFSFGDELKGSIEVTEASIVDEVKQYRNEHS